MKNTAVYAGMFDPVTYGHIDLVERAARIFDQVIVAVAVNKNKNPLFTLDERIDLCSQVFESYENVFAAKCEGLLLDFAKQHGANVILRGLRAVADFDYEFQLASMNRFLNQQIETLFLMPAEKYMYISSSLVREIASFGGDVTGFVPSVVRQALEKKFKK